MSRPTIASLQKELAEAKKRQSDAERRVSHLQETLHNARDDNRRMQATVARLRDTVEEQAVQIAEMRQDARAHTSLVAKIATAPDIPF